MGFCNQFKYSSSLKKRSPWIFEFVSIRILSIMVVAFTTHNVSQNMDQVKKRTTRRSIKNLWKFKSMFHIVHTIYLSIILLNYEQQPSSKICKPWNTNLKNLYAETIHCLQLIEKSPRFLSIVEDTLKIISKTEPCTRLWEILCNILQQRTEPFQLV